MVMGTVTMADEPLSAEREALLAITMATGDAVDVAVRILGVMEQQSEHVAEIGRNLTGLRRDLGDLQRAVEAASRRN